MHVNVPVALTVAPQLPINVPPVLIDSVTVTPGLNPVPDTTVESPVGPWLGVSVTAGVVTVNVASAVSDGTVPTSEPLAVIVYAAEAPLTATVAHVNVPSDATVAPQLPVNVPPGLIDSVTVTPGLKPVPATVVEIPGGPCVGVRVIAATVPVNVSVA